MRSTNRRKLASLAVVLASAFHEVVRGEAQETSGYEGAIYEACQRHGCDGSQLVRVMYCESGGDPGAVGPNGERGIFQFHPYGEWPYAAWYGPYEQIELAAQLFASGRADAWVCQ